MSGNSFRFQTDSTDDQGSISTFPTSSEIQDVEEAAVAHREDSDAHGSVKDDPEGAEVDDAKNIQDERGNVVEAFEETAAGKVFHNFGSSFRSSLSTICKENWLDMGKINDVQVKIAKLRMGEQIYKNHLDRHIDVVHKKMKQNQCSQCLKKFGKKSDLRKHIKAVHNKEQPYQCNQCLKKFSYSSNLAVHIGVVHNKETPHACTQPGCAQKFGQKQNLKKHMMTAHNFEKPFACIEQNCDKKFVEDKHLKDHLRSVHGAAKLVCGFENCAATFTFQGTLWMHKKKHHSDK